MKNIFFALCAAFLATTFWASCNRDNSTVTAPDEAKYQKEIDFLVNEWHISPNDIEVNGNEITIEGDMVMEADNFWDQVSERPTIDANGEVIDRQHYQYTSSLVSTPNPPRWITINVLSTVTSVWANVIYDAAQAWNARKSKVRFAVQSGAQEIVGAINVKGESLGSSVFASTNMPVSGTPGKYLRVNTGSNAPAMSADQRLKTIAHEIGHAVGLGHPNVQESGFSLITNVSTTCKNNADNESKMRQGLINWGTGWSPCDKEAIKALYGELAQ